MSLFEPDDPIRGRRKVNDKFVGIRRARWVELTDDEKEIEWNYLIKQNKALAKRLGVEL